MDLKTKQIDVVEWEGDEILLPDMFEQLSSEEKEEFFVFEADVKIDNKLKEGFIGYHFTDRQIWLQHKETFYTIILNLATAGRYYRDLYDDYHTQKRRFRRLQKQRQKLNGRKL